jgi:hypothetical protein
MVMVMTADGDQPRTITFSTDELAREAEREVVLRETVYPRLIMHGKMTPAVAKQRIERMREIARRLRHEEEKERLL